MDDIFLGHTQRDNVWAPKPQSNKEKHMWEQDQNYEY